MHLLAATPGAVSDGSEPVDPEQTPADIVVLSAADSDLAALADARAAWEASWRASEEAGRGAASRLSDPPPSLRLAQLSWLAHPYAVDLYLEKTALRSRLVVARILGGRAYWPYGLEQFAQRLAAAGASFLALPGDAADDAELRAVSTVASEAWEAAFGYFTEGGPENMGGFLRLCRALLDPPSDPSSGRASWPPPPAPVLKAGLLDLSVGGPVQNEPPAEAPEPSARATADAPEAARGGGDAARLKATWRANGRGDAPVAAVVFYRALLLGGGLEPVRALVDALTARGINATPIFVSSLKDPISAATLAAIFAETPPDLVLNATAFAVGAPGDAKAARASGTSSPLDAPGRPVLQVVFASGSEDGWAAGAQGLAARDIAMHVALPEVDGRVLTRAVSFKAEAYRDPATECAIARHRPKPDRIAFVADLAAAWIRLAKTPPKDRRVALVLANYPSKDGRLANGVGLDTPASCVAALAALRQAGYRLDGAPADAAALMRALQAGPTNDRRRARTGGARLSLSDYRAAFAALPETARREIETRWGAPETDPFFTAAAANADGAPEPGFQLPVLTFGHVVVGVQPARGYHIDPEESYHSPDLPPPHGYLAFYVWLRRQFGAQAIAHFGKHGNLEWLPGKALALSETCFPEIALGPTPQVYPFIVNDPGEGAQAKRRGAAVIIDHLTPPLTRAESYGPLRDLERLVDEYYQAAGLDPKRVAHLRREILSLSAASGLDADLGFDVAPPAVGASGEPPSAEEQDADSRLARLDAYLCELKESQIRDGLHVFGTSPTERLETDLLAALARAPRGGRAGDASLIRALATDFALTPPVPGQNTGPRAPAFNTALEADEKEVFDPLDCAFATPWTGPRPAPLLRRSPDPWRTAGDAVERLELFAAALIAGDATPPGPASAAVLAALNADLRPRLRACGPREMGGLLTALDGGFVPPGPSGAPTRGRPETLPTGRNFYSVDTRAMPTRTAWTLGWRSASMLVERHLQDQGDWPRSMALSAWGTACMRTGGDDAAQALALMGARPVWDDGGDRVTGFEVMPLSVLGRPRVDVTLRVSGFFRDAFPGLMDLIASAARAVMEREEPEAENPAAARFRRERLTLGDERAGRRVFGSKPGAYGAGLQALIETGHWRDRADFADAYMAWGSYAYGAGADGAEDREAFATRLGTVEAVVQNQDNREHDLLDSDDYYQFEGGLSAAVAAIRGAQPTLYHNDHSRPERPLIRTLDEEIARVVRARAINPKWIEGVKRHGYKGAFEIAATVDYLFAFAATTDAVKPHHFDLAFEAYVENDATRAFIEDANPAALREIIDRFQEAIDRGLWTPRKNSTAMRLEAMRKGDGA